MAGLETVPVEVVAFASELEERRAILHYNLQRDKTFTQKMREAEELEAIEKEEAEARMLAGKKPDPPDTCQEGLATGETLDIVAAAVGLGSGSTYRLAKVVWEAAKVGDSTAIDLVEKLDIDEMTIARAQSLLQDEQKLRVVRAKISTLEGIQVDDLAGEYDVIVVDPPWPC